MKDNFGTIEDQMRYSNSIGSWWHNLWKKTKEGAKRDWLKLKDKEHKLKVKVKNLFHKKNKTQEEHNALADAQSQLKDTQNKLADLQMQLDLKDQMLSDSASTSAQNNATKPSWYPSVPPVPTDSTSNNQIAMNNIEMICGVKPFCILTKKCKQKKADYQKCSDDIINKQGAGVGNIPSGTGENIKDDSSGSGDVASIVIGLGIAALVIWGISREVKLARVRGVH